MAEVEHLCDTFIGNNFFTIREIDDQGKKCVKTYINYIRFIWKEQCNIMSICDKKLVMKIEVIVQQVYVKDVYIMRVMHGEQCYVDFVLMIFNL